MHSVRFSLVLCIALMSLLTFVAAAAAHSWYDGWCCNDRDCAPVPESTVVVTDEGWRYLPTGEVVPYGDRREQPSEDGRFHACTNSDGGLRCLYVPGFGS